MLNEDVPEPGPDEQVAAVVVTYNRKAYLQRCLRALQQQTHPVASIWVVDNASTDGTDTMVRDAFPAVHLIRFSGNRGGAGGFHEGMRQAASGCAWVWVMDDDAEPKPDALAALVATGLHRDPGTAALASLKVDPQGAPQEEHTSWYDPVRMDWRWEPARGRAHYRIGYSSFVGLLMARRAIEAVGLPHADFFIWYDDVEYCLRLLKAGAIYLVRDSIVVHHKETDERGRWISRFGRKTIRRPFSQAWRYYYLVRNPLLIVHQHVDRPTLRWLGYARGIYRFGRSLAAVLVWDDHKVRRIQVLAKGLLHGLAGIRGKRVDPSRFRDATGPPA